jgi:hypothetical protein
VSSHPVDMERKIIPVNKTDEYIEYINYHGQVETAFFVEEILQGYFNRDDISKKHVPPSIMMKVHHDPEIVGYSLPQPTIIFPERVLDDTGLIKGLEEYTKKFLANKSKDVEEFKKLVYRWREFRIIFSWEGR